MLAPGTVFAGYEIVGQLGKGGMGAVYEAIQLTLGRRVALKVISPDLGEDEDFRRRFLREGRMQANLDHPNVVTVHEAAAADDGTLFIAMRLVRGHDLKQLMAGAPLEPERALRILGQVAEALDAAHEEGMVHRDVKPQNILVGARDHAYLADFGLVKVVNSQSATNTRGGTVGTLQYMSPEQIRGDGASGASDIYALSAVLFESLTGGPPFRKDSEAAMLFAHLNDRPPSAHERRPELPVELDGVIARGMDKSAARRPASAAALIDAARAAVDGREVVPPVATDTKVDAEATIVRPAGEPTLRPGDRTTAGDTLAPAVTDAGATAASATREPERPRRRALLIGGGLLAAVIVAVVVVLVAGGSSKSVTVAPNAVGVLDAAGHVQASVPVGAAPGAVAAGEGAVWAVNTDDNTVSRIDPDSNAVTQTITVGAGPAGVATGGGFVWVTNSLDGTVSRIDPHKNGGAVSQTIGVGNQPTGIAFGHGSVWVANSADATVTRIDPATGQARKAIPTGSGADAIAVGDQVWVTSSAAGRITELDPRTGRAVQTVGVGHGPSAVAVGADAVWVVNALDGTVSKVDPERASVGATVAVGRDPGGVAVADGSVWVTEESGQLVDIDPAGATVTRRVQLGNRPRAVTVAPDRVYVAVAAAGAAHRGGTTRLVTSDDAIDSLDPAKAYAPLSWSILSNTGDGLLGFRRVSGRAGGELVPDLAVSLPAPTEGGRTYTFRLRPGIRYANGQPVRAADVRHSIERTFTVPGSPGPTTYYGGIVGAAACLHHKGPCSLSRGIAVDERNRQVTFHLVAPDPDLPYKLALPTSFVVPSSTPDTEVPNGVPATGPYRIAERTRTRLVLARNPKFRVWSRAAQPDGYPDAMSIRLDLSPDQQLAAVRTGRADWGFEVGTASPKLVAQLATRYASRLHINPARSLVYVFLDTTRPPFNDVRVRRALNLAVDRRVPPAVLALHPTCQILPPDFLGYVPYCPYALARGGNLRAARRLVAASGKQGATVSLWSPGSGPQARAVVPVAAALQKLGFRLRLRRVPGDIGAYFGALQAPGAPRPQAGFYSWDADYPAPSSFITPQLACHAPSNLSHFCVTPLATTGARATGLQVSRPQAAGALWRRVDRGYTDLAPWVPLANINVIDLLSARTGNYRYNPEWGVLLDQLWVR